MSKLRTERARDGEPLDADPDSMSYEEAEYWCRMDDYDAAEDTPRKPEPGDRVRVSYEAEYHEHADDGHFVRPNDLDFPILTPSDVEITVIEPARPAVPEDPKCDVEEEAGLDVLPWRYNGSRYNNEHGQVLTWDRLWATSQEIGSKLYPIRYERGPVIGGE